MVRSGSNSGETLEPGYQIDWTVTSNPPGYRWPSIGTYTAKTWVTGTCTDGTSKTLYSYAYPVVVNTCKLVSNTAYVSQDNSCTNSITTVHKFDNKGNYSVPHSANFYLYDPNNNLVDQTSNSYTAPVDQTMIWTVTWRPPASGWKAGTYRSQANLNGTCSNGGITSPSNTASPVMPASCSPASCNGTVSVNVSNNSGNPIPNAKVYLDNTYYSSTDFSGGKTVSTTDASCGNSHRIDVRCADNTYCSSQSTTINYNNDDDPLSFVCGMCVSSASKLNPVLSANTTYAKNDPISLQITIQDTGGNPVSGASISTYDPFTNMTSSVTASGSTYTYHTTASKTGTYTFTVTITKSGYESATATKTVTVAQTANNVQVTVTDSKSRPVITGKVYLDGTYRGDTDLYGKKSMLAATGSHQVELYCPNYDYCSGQSVNVNGSTSLRFSCPCDDSDGDGFDNQGEELAGSNPGDPASTPFTPLSNYNVTDLLQDAKNAPAALVLKNVKLQGKDTVVAEGIQSGTCGFTEGLVRGAVGGLVGTFRSILDLVVMLANGAWYILTHTDTIQKISTALTDFIHKMSTFSRNDLIAIWSNYWRDLLVEMDSDAKSRGGWYAFSCGLSTPQDWSDLRNTYAIGKTSGYAIELVAEFVFTVSLASDLKAGMKSGELAGKLASALTRAEKIWEEYRVALLGITAENRVTVAIFSAVGKLDEVLRITVTLQDGTTKIFRWTGETLLSIPGAKKIDNWGHEIVSEITASAIKAPGESLGLGSNDIKILSGATDEVIAYNEDYVVAFSDKGKNTVKTWARSNVELSADRTKISSKAGNPVGELDGLGLIDGKKPIVIEAKTGPYSNFKKEIDISDLKRKKLDPLESVFNEKPTLVISVPKGEAYTLVSGEKVIKPKLGDIESQLQGTVLEMPLTNEELQSMSDTLLKNYRNIGGGS
ncbi:MAG: carboxypeptidase regulatory-like domain-containing protein [Candidatus Diapherotrites archaeon]|nr:carboxypeptidase regulatory-like domain-containing protein [Candidatus Diapherotrites archaeon]